MVNHNQVSDLPRTFMAAKPVNRANCEAAFLLLACPSQPAASLQLIHATSVLRVHVDITKISKGDQPPACVDSPGKHYRPSNPCDHYRIVCLGIRDALSQGRPTLCGELGAPPSFSIVEPGAMQTAQVAAWATPRASLSALLGRTRG